MNRLRVIGRDDGELLGAAGTSQDRFILGPGGVGGLISLVEHILPPYSLAAPLHYHHDEDEYSFVISGRVGARLGGVDLVGEAGSVTYKPRGEWHTFWNAGDTPARILEIISPGGFEEAFREIHALGELADPAAIARIGAKYRVETDFEGTGPLVEQHGLEF